MIYAGLMAAGIGVRMHRQDLPKPFLMLGEKPILLHAMEQFLVNARVERIVIVAPEDWTLYARDLLEAHDMMGKEFHVIPGGSNKTESIFALVEYIAEAWGIGEEDLLIVHDAVRPFITQRIIDDNIEAAARYGAANTVISTNDTTIVSRAGQKLEEVPPHEHMFAQQTPQTYRLSLLKSGFARAEEEGAALWEENEFPRLYIRYGNVMRLVNGEYSNMKIINPYDLEVAGALLKERKL